MLRNADGGGGVTFSGKKRYEGVRYNVISITWEKALRMASDEKIHRGVMKMTSKVHHSECGSAIFDCLFVNVGLQ